MHRRPARGDGREPVRPLPHRLRPAPECHRSRWNWRSWWRKNCRRRAKPHGASRCDTSGAMRRGGRGRPPPGHSSGRTSRRCARGRVASWGRTAPPFRQRRSAPARSKRAARRRASAVRSAGERSGNAGAPARWCRASPSSPGRGHRRRRRCQRQEQHAPVQRPPAQPRSAPAAPFPQSRASANTSSSSVASRAARRGLEQCRDSGRPRTSMPMTSARCRSRPRGTAPAPGAIRSSRNTCSSAPRHAPRVDVASLSGRPPSRRSPSQ